MPSLEFHTSHNTCYLQLFKQMMVDSMPPGIILWLYWCCLDSVKYYKKTCNILTLSNVHSQKQTCTALKLLKLARIGLPNATMFRSVSPIAGQIDNIIGQ
jgi:hypothetical protein